MGSVLSYSGLSTKIRAMQSRLVTDEQLEEIVQLPNVPQVTAYLKRTPEYQNVWSGLDENDLHRGQIEKLLKKSIFLNFSRLYHFANQEQRTFLSLYSRRYEIRVLKEIMTNLFDHRDTDPVDISPYRDFFRHHSKLDIDRLAACTNMDEFIAALKGNDFFIPLSQVNERGNATLFDFGMALDLSYFSQIWNVRKKLFKGNDLKQITRAYGEIRYAEPAVHPALQTLLSDGTGCYLRTAGPHELQSSAKRRSPPLWKPLHQKSSVVSSMGLIMVKIRTADRRQSGRIL